MSRLILFDIDGTIVTDGGASRQAFGSALAQVYDYSGDLGQYDFSGRTDPQIAHMVLSDFGLTSTRIDARIEELWRIYLAALANNATPARVRVLPGIEALLAKLATCKDVVLALLTGNIEPGARLKLGAPQLNHYFEFGAFGSDSAKREELPPIAVARAAASGHHISGRDVVIIGDSIYDVRCGVPHAATTIAVASGKTSAERLRAESPDHFFESAENVDGILEAMLG
jgi:phosphoglycolate phosphatase